LTPIGLGLQLVLIHRAVRFRLPTFGKASTACNGTCACCLRPLFWPFIVSCGGRLLAAGWTRFAAGICSTMRFWNPQVSIAQNAVEADRFGDVRLSTVAMDNGRSSGQELASEGNRAVRGNCQVAFISDFRGGKAQGPHHLRLGYRTRARLLCGQQGEGEVWQASSRGG